MYALVAARARRPRSVILLYIDDRAHSYKQHYGAHTHAPRDPERRGPRGGGGGRKHRQTHTVRSGASDTLAAPHCSQTTHAPHQAHERAPRGTRKRAGTPARRARPERKSRLVGRRGSPLREDRQERRRRRSDIVLVTAENLDLVTMRERDGNKVDKQRLPIKLRRPTVTMAYTHAVELVTCLIGQPPNTRHPARPIVGSGAIAHLDGHILRRKRCDLELVRLAELVRVTKAHDNATLRGLARRIVGRRDAVMPCHTARASERPGSAGGKGARHTYHVRRAGIAHHFHPLVVHVRWLELCVPPRRDPGPQPRRARQRQQCVTRCDRFSQCQGRPYSAWDAIRSTRT